MKLISARTAPVRSLPRRSAVAAASLHAALLAGAAGQIISPITNQPAPVSVCFAPGTDPGYMEAVTRLVDAQNAIFDATDYHIFSSWPVAQGNPVTLTWSFVPDGLSLPGSNGEPTSPSELFAKMDAAFAAQGGRAAWINRFQQAMDRWGQVSGVKYTRVIWTQDWDDGAVWGSGSSTGRRGDVRIGMHFIDGVHGILAYNGYPPAGDMVLDSGDISWYADSTGQHIQFRNTIAHELGHGLGFAHTCSLGNHVLMEPLEEGGYDGPQQDDIRAAHRNYGDAYEPNETAGAAKHMGTLGAGGLTFGTISTPPSGLAVPGAAALSIDAAGKVDYFTFSLAATIPAGITVTPVGTTYDSSPQAGNGSCPGIPTNVNGLAAADLAFQVFGNGGATLLGTANATGPGAAESLTLPPLGPGTYQVRVFAANSPTTPQLYRINMSCPAPTMTAQPTTVGANANDTVTFTVAANNATGYRWRRNGVNLNEGGNIIGSATPTLKLSPVKMGDAGSYSCSVTNACGTTFSTAVALTVSCYPNCDGSTAPPILNVADFTCFIQRFFANDPWANCDGSTATPNMNILDFICFQNKFWAGCS